MKENQSHSVGDYRPPEAIVASAILNNGRNEARNYILPQSLSSICASADAELINIDLKKLGNPSWKSDVKPESIAEQLSQVLTELHYYMGGRFIQYFKNDFYHKLLSRLKDLLDPDGWDEADKIPNHNSFNTFVEFLIFLKEVKKIDKFPMIGLSYTGNFIAVWSANKDHLEVECLPNQKLHWVLVKYFSHNPETASGNETTIQRFIGIVNTYNPEKWFVNERKA